MPTNLPQPLMTGALTLRNRIVVSRELLRDLRVARRDAQQLGTTIEAPQQYQHAW